MPYRRQTEASTDVPVNNKIKPLHQTVCCRLSTDVTKIKVSLRSFRRGYHCQTDAVSKEDAESDVPLKVESRNNQFHISTFFLPFLSGEVKLIGPHFFLWKYGLQQQQQLKYDPAISGPWKGNKSHINRRSISFHAVCLLVSLSVSALLTPERSHRWLLQITKDKCAACRLMRGCFDESSLFLRREIFELQVSWGALM